MKYIASCSFGKDSLAAIAARIAHGEHIDDVLYCRIMFDDNISAELPEHEEWIHCHAIPLLKSRYGLNTTIVQAETTYTRQFYKKYAKGGWIGQKYGFPMLKGPWCNSLLKVGPLTEWQRAQGEHIQLIGIAADETKRIERNSTPGKLLPLVDYGMTEADAFNLCQKIDLLSPAYSSECTRLGCWFCHNQRISELRRLCNEYPQLWQRLLDMEVDSPRTFRPDWTLVQLNERFEYENSQLCLW